MCFIVGIGVDKDFATFNSVIFSHYLVDEVGVPVQFGGIRGSNASGAPQILVVVDDKLTVSEIEIHLDGADVAASFGRLFLFLFVFGHFGLVFQVENAGE